MGHRAEQRLRHEQIINLLLADEPDGCWTATPSARELVERHRATRIAGLRQLSADEVESLTRATSAIERLARAVDG